MTTLWNWFRALLFAAIVLGGYVVYLVRRKTPAIAYKSMVKLFCLTGGRSNDVLSRLVGTFARRHRFTEASGVLGNMAASNDLGRVVASLRERGYYVFEKRLPDEVCDRLLTYATSQPSVPYLMDGQSSGPSGSVVYDRDHPRAVRYEFRTQDLLDNPDVQTLLADLSFASVAQEYLGSPPMVDVVSMWWLTAFSDRPDSKAAQYFHFDMDRPKWLKFFINLTDVTSATGPHTFVAGSHRTGAIPAHLLDKGYSRLTDAEVQGAFASRDILEFAGARGTILAEDTRGLHKGRHVEKGDRLMLQIQFSNSLFGGDYPKVAFKRTAIPALEDRFRKFPELYSAYL